MSRPEGIRSHLRRMRTTAAAALGAIPVAVAAAVLIPHRGAALASPGTITAAAAVASLWLAFSAERDARARLEGIRRAFAVHGDERRLLRDHWLVYLVVVLRLEALAVCGLVVALWGVGPSVGVWLVLLGGLLLALTWPTARKAQLLLGRARALRGDGAS